MNSEASISLEGRAILEMLQDHLAAQRLAIAWLMSQLCPDESRDWLDIQHRTIEKDPNLSEIAIELEALKEDLDEITKQTTNTIVKSSSTT